MKVQDIWAVSERLDILFSLLPKRIQNRRKGSYLRALTTEYMDYMTRSNTVTEQQAAEIGRAILAIRRTACSIEALYGRPIDSNIVHHSLFGEMENLFGNSQQAFDAVDFTLFTAALVSRRAELPVLFIPPTDHPSPDLRVSELCYIECKDLSVGSAANIQLGVRDRLEDAREQLRSAQEGARLPAAGVAMDVPLLLVGAEHVHSSEAIHNASEVIRQTLTSTGPIDFALLSISGIHKTTGIVSFPHRLAVFTRPTLPSKILSLLGKLTPDSRVHICP
jgi:hypothetical protein